MSGEIAPEVVERMVALVHTMSVHDSGVSGGYATCLNAHSEAKAIANLLRAAADPDGLLAREIVADLYPDAAPENENALITCAYHAIKRARGQ